MYILEEQYPSETLAAFSLLEDNSFKCPEGITEEEQSVSDWGTFSIICVQGGVLTPFLGGLELDFSA